MARVNLALSAKLGNGFDRLERQGLDRYPGQNVLNGALQHPAKSRDLARHYIILCAAFSPPNKNDVSTNRYI
jgi:hypothetical protein